ncbi:MAG: dockerin type I repeat-containing protein [Candidatus Zixiibacteriota bacterium]
MRSLSTIIFGAGLFIFLLVCTGFAESPKSGLNDGMTKSDALSVDNTTYIDGNRIFMFVTNHGSVGRDLSDMFGYDYGTFYPYTSVDDIISGANTSSPLYAAGLWMGGRVNTEVRIAIAEYSSEYVPGPMLGGTYQNDRPEFRVYKLYRDSLASNPNADYFGYMTYAVAQGAPLDSFGEPLVHGEQTLWTVYNDADPAQHTNNSGETDPLGIEVHQTVWSTMESGDNDIIIPINYLITQLGASETGVVVSGTSTDVPDGHDYMITTGLDSENGMYWNLIDVTLGVTLLDHQYGSSVTTSDGIQINIDFASRYNWNYESASPANLSPVALADDPFYEGGRWFTGGQHGGELFFGGVFIEPDFWGGTTVPQEEIKPIEIRFRPMASYTDLNGDGSYTIGEPYIVDDPLQTQNAFLYQSFDGAHYKGFYPIPFTAWDVSDPMNPRQLNVVVRDRDGDLAWDLHILHDPSETDITGLPNGGDIRYNYVWILNTDYDPIGTYYGNGTGGTIDFFGADGGNSLYDAMWVLWLDDRHNGGMLAEECTFALSTEYAEPVDTFLFTSSTPEIFSSGPDASALYIEYKLYNKGGNTIDDFYVSFWSDPDVGGAGDDLVGCDTLHDIFFAYNADNDDTQYPTPPCLGFKVIHGPLVASPGDTAVFAGNLIPNHKNIGMVSFNKYFNALDPDNFAETYNYMRGLWPDGSPYAYNGDTIRYQCSGDPVIGTGDLDTAPDDRRMMASFGPFDFNPGDSQYVLIKMAVGLGDDRLQSITAAKDILNYQPPADTTDPHSMVSIMRPSPQNVIFKNAIEPVIDTLIIGRASADIEDIEFASLRINNTIIPFDISYIDFYPGTGGRALQMLFPAAEFLEGYGNVWDLQIETYSLTGTYVGGEPLVFAGQFLLRGHRSGDANGDGVIMIGDAVYLINYIFRDGTAPDPIQLGDANSDGSVNLGDAIFLLNYIFRNGPAPGE